MNVISILHVCTHGLTTVTKRYYIIVHVYVALYLGVPLHI
jgi:hypothetical protein